MNFNSDFWVTVGTAAPVIALSCIVLISDVADIASNEHLHNKEVTLYESRITVLRAVQWAAWIDGVDLGTQAALFYAALNSLLTRRNYWPEETVAVIEGSAIVLLFFSTGLMGASKFGIKQYQNTLPVLRNKPVNRPPSARRKAKSSGYRYDYATKRLTTTADHNSIRVRRTKPDKGSSESPGA